MTVGKSFVITQRAKLCRDKQRLEKSENLGKEEPNHVRARAFPRVESGAVKELRFGD